MAEKAQGSVDGPRAVDAPEMQVDPQLPSAVVSQCIGQVERIAEALEEQTERLHETLASLEILAVDGYFVKVWPDLEADVWVAHCPAVRCVAQEETRDLAAAAIKESIAEMLDALASVGAPQPARDVWPREHFTTP